MKNTLKTHMASKTLISVYTNRYEWDSFSFGRLAYLSNEILVLEAYTKFGDRSGFEVRKIESVSKIEVGGIYETCLAALIRAEEPEHSGLSLDTMDLGGDFVGVLLAAKDSGAIVSVWGDDDDQAVVGTVSSIFEHTIEISLLDRYGRKDGTSLVNISEITAIDYETRELQLLRKFATLSES